MQDVAYALRAFRRNPAFFAVAALTLALAVGGNTAVFSVLDAAVLRSLPFPDADRLVFVNGYHLTDWWSVPSAWRRCPSSGTGGRGRARSTHWWPWTPTR